MHTFEAGGLGQDYLASSFDFLKQTQNEVRALLHDALHCSIH
jgi:hypothetical protein